MREAQVISDNHLGLYPEPLVTGLQPDLLAEYFVLESVRRQNTFLSVFKLAWRLSPQKTSDFLVRCARDFAWHDALPLLLDHALKNLSGKALDRFLRSATQICANYFDSKTEVPQSLFTLLETAGRSYSTAKLFLATCYQRGNGVEQDLGIAFKILSE
ncbi:MAG: hypothetical protein AAF223_15225, partial [Bacteroidota bacterium]